jgi:transposase-like protein
MPPFCPNPQCPFHSTAEGWPFKKSGFFTRKHCQPARIQRYRCLHCRRNFSSQTFQTTYWLHQPELQTRIFHRIQACSGLRQIADEYNVSPTTIQDHVSRLGRHCLLFQHQHRPQVREPLVLDGFESFEYSQFFPFHFNVLVGKNSHFFYQFTDSPLRRKGRMTERQRLRRVQLEKTLGRPDPRSIQKEVEELLRLAVPESQTLTLHSDDHPAYPRAFRALPQLTIQHQVTPSTDRRTPHNPLFPVNLLDLLIRHGGANHKRETIAFSKRRQGAIERLAILQVWRNFVRPFSKRRKGSTPAQRAGVMEGRLEVKKLLGRRLFASKIPLPQRLERYYRRETQTAPLGVNRGHRLRYAY